MKLAGDVVIPKFDGRQLGIQMKEEDGSIYQLVSTLGGLRANGGGQQGGDQMGGGVCTGRTVLKGNERGRVFF